MLFTSILLFVNYQLQQADIPIRFFNDHKAATFFCLLFISIIVNKVFQSYLIRLTNQITFHFEASVINKLRNANYESFQRVGLNKIYSVFNDTRTLGRIPEALLNAINSFVIFVCGITYLFWVSIPGALGIIILMAILGAVYVARNSAIEKDLNIVRDLQDEFHKYLKDFLLGFREIKLSSARVGNIVRRLNQNRMLGKNLSTKTSTKYLENELIGSYGWYIVLGSVLFIIPSYVHFTAAQISSYVVTILYLIGPAAGIIGAYSFFTGSKITIERVVAVEKELQRDVKEEASATGDSKLNHEPFSAIAFENVAYEYYEEGLNRTFNLGPINVEFKKGELVFLTGGNGSGKTTFVNLLTGIFQPQSGSLVYNCHPVGAGDTISYRNKFGAIFSDPYLFSTNYDDYDLSLRQEELQEYLKIMRLEKMHIGNNKQIIGKLSKGQSKRLALIYNLLENRPILVLDEWAAEQDPEFKAYFYRGLLPFLQQKGITLIVVTHDEEFFGCADRVIKFDTGKILRDEAIKEKVLAF